jgi:hypothetical protein
MKRTHNFLHFITVLMFLVITTLVVSAADSKKIPHKIPLMDAGAKIRVDGKLDENTWSAALKLTLDYEVHPGENIKPPVRTDVFLLYSKTNLYIAFYAYDPDPRDIRAHIMDRDKIWNEDWVMITVDPFNDQRRAYSFTCNPFGIQSESVETKDGTDYNWDTIWKSAGRIVDNGYIVEMAIPFSSLRFQRKKEEQVWGIDIVRRYPRNSLHMIGLIPQDRNNNCYLCQFDKIVGFKGVKPGKNIELDPSVSLLYTREREEFPDGPFNTKNKKVDPGITARWAFTPNMTLSAAVNPDFSNVEADGAQMDVNTQWALFYKEKRPFFLEGNELFDTTLPVIYTRAMVDPDWGIKLTGKEGANAIGLYSVQDNTTNLLIPSTYYTRSTVLDMKTLVNVLRYRRDLGKASTIGVLVSDREGDDYFNRLAGVDAYWRMNRSKEIKFQFLASQTRYPDQVITDYQQPEGKFYGTALDASFRHSSRNLGYYAFYQQITPAFRGDLGFITQVGYRTVRVGFIHAWYKEDGHWYTFFNINPQYDYEFDFNGNMIYKSAKVISYYLGPAQSSIRLQAQLGKRAYLGKIFDTDSIQVRFGIKPSGSLQLWLDLAYGNHIDFVNTQGGKRLKLFPVFLYSPSKRFTFVLDHQFERFDLKKGRLYTANVSNLRMEYQFDKRIFFRTILQYVDYNYNVEYYTVQQQPRFKNFFTQLLLSYKLNPQTVFFLGYSDDYYGYRYIPLKQKNHTLFLKIGYALRI